MKDEIVIDGVTYIKKPEAKKVERVEFWCVKDIYGKNPEFFIKNPHCESIHLIQLRTNERVLSEDDVIKILTPYLSKLWLNYALKELGFGGSE